MPTLSDIEAINAPLLTRLQLLATDCERDDARATQAPWIWTDEAFLWHAESDCGVLNHGETDWPVSPDNRAVIAASRNRLSELARTLKEAARRVDFLENLTIHRARDRDQLRERILQLEAALHEALDIAKWEASEHQGKREHLERLPQLRAVLAETV